MERASSDLPVLGIQCRSNLVEHYVSSAPINKSMKKTPQGSIPIVSTGGGGKGILGWDIL